MDGRIKVHRKILEWEWYADPNTFRVFLHILLSANHKNNKWQGILIDKGSFITSFEKLSIAVGLSIQQVRTAIAKLESTGEITRKTTSKWQAITVCRWENYQNDEEEATNKQQTNNKQITTNKNDKKEENNKWSDEQKEDARKTYPHTRSGKKKETIDHFGKHDAEIVLGMIRTLKREVAVGIKDAKFIQASQRRARDFVAYPENVKKKVHLDIYKTLLNEKKEMIEEFMQDFGKEYVLQLYNEIKGSETKNLLSSLQK